MKSTRFARIDCIARAHEGGVEKINRNRRFLPIWCHSSTEIYFLVINCPKEHTGLIKMLHSMWKKVLARRRFYYLNQWRRIPRFKRFPNKEFFPLSLHISETSSLLKLKTPPSWTKCQSNWWLRHVHSHLFGSYLM